jgi:hypothetical protein
VGWGSVDEGGADEAKSRGCSARHTWRGGRCNHRCGGRGSWGSRGNGRSVRGHQHLGR